VRPLIGDAAHSLSARLLCQAFDGRIDDPAADRKGHGLWSTSGDRTPWLMEGRKEAKPRAVHLQLRPDPLAN
jgi:hypothetical protein